MPLGVRNWIIPRSYIFQEIQAEDIEPLKFLFITFQTDLNSY